ncbi:MAG: L,D-transpeptidase [Firmicutes bacterium]|nr:L,D-transpeptidase [Bacillota bacterium]
MAGLKRAILVIIFCFSVLNSGVAAGSEREWSIRINIPACTLELLRHGEVWRRFPVAVGRKVTPTPVGSFTIKNIIKNPTWYPVGRDPVPPGVDNPLGGYWLGLSISGYGIHGNNKPTSIGHPESNGCIRMHNQDVELLVRLVQVGTPVEILYRTVEVEAVKDKIWLTLYPDLYQRESGVQEEVRSALQVKTLPYPVHWGALWQLLDGERPLIIEIPRELPLILDGEEYPESAFFWGERVFLPVALAGLWGEERDQPFIELLEFMRSYAGQVYGFFDQQAKTINLHTLRIYCNGRLFPLRGWFQEEPCLPRELVEFIWQEAGPPVRDLLPPVAEGEERWVPLSVLSEGWPHLELDWDEKEWVLRIGI